MSKMDPKRFCFSALSAFTIAVALLQRPVFAGPIPVFPGQRQQLFNERDTQVVFERRVTAQKSVIRTKFTPEDTRLAGVYNNPADPSRFSSSSNRDPEFVRSFQEFSRTRAAEFPFQTGQEIRDSKSGILHSNPDCLQPVKTLSNACSHPGFFYIEGDCKKYLVCLSGSGNVLESFVIACPDDKLFSRIYRRCVPPHLSDCGRNVEYEHVPRRATISPEIFDRYLAHYGITSERLSKFLERDTAENAFNRQPNRYGNPKATESEHVEIFEPKRYPDEKFKNVDVRIEETFTIPENFDSESEIPVEVVKEFEVVSEIETPAHGIPPDLTNSESSFDPRPLSSDDEPAIPYPYVSSADVDFDNEPAAASSGQTQFENSNEKEDAKIVPEEYLSKIPSDSEAGVPIAYSVPDEVETLPESTKEFEVASEIETPANPIQLEDVYDPVEISDPELPFEPTLAANDAGSASGYTDVPSGDVEFGKDAAQYESHVQFENSMEEDRITPAEEVYFPEIPADVPADSVDVREEFLLPNDFAGPEFLIESEANDDEKAEESVKELEVVTEVEKFNGPAEIADSELPLEPIQLDEDELAVAYPGEVSGDEGELGFDEQQSEFNVQAQSETENDGDTVIPNEEIYVKSPSTTEHEIPDVEEELYSQRDLQVPVFSSESESETLSEPLKEVEIVSEFETPAEGIRLDEVNDLSQISDSEIAYEPTQPSDEAEFAFVYPDVSSGDVEYEKEPADFQGQAEFENFNEEDKAIPQEEQDEKIPPYSSAEYEIPAEHSPSTDDDFPIPVVPTESEADKDQTPSEFAEELEIVSEVEIPADAIQVQEFVDQSEASDSELPLRPIHSSDEGGPGIGYTWASSDDFSIDKQAEHGGDTETEVVNEDDLVEEQIYISPHSSSAEFEIPSEHEILDVNEEFHSPDDFPTTEFPIESEANEDSELLLEPIHPSGEDEPIAYPAPDEVETLPESESEFEVISEVEEFNDPTEISDSVETPADPTKLEDVYDSAEIYDPDIALEPTLAASDDGPPIVYADVPSGDVEFDKGAAEFESQAQFENSKEDDRITPEEKVYFQEIPSDSSIPEDPVDVKEEFNSPNDFSVPEFPTEYETDDGGTLPESANEFQVVSEVEEFNDPAEISDSEPPFEAVQSSGEDGAAIGYPDGSREDFLTDKKPEFEIEVETRSENSEDEVVVPEEAIYVPPHSSSTEFEILSEHEIPVAKEEFQSPDDSSVPEFPIEAETIEDSHSGLPLESTERSDDDELANGNDEHEELPEAVREFEVVSEIETPADEIQLVEVYDQAETSDSELPLQPALLSSDDEQATAYTEASGGEVQLDKDEAEFEGPTRVENSEDEDAIIPEEETYLPAIPSEAELPEDTVVIDEESYSPSDFSVPEFPTEFETDDDQRIPEFIKVSEIEEFDEPTEFSESKQPFLSSSDPEAANSYPDFSSDQISYDKDPAEVEGQSQTEPEKVVIVEDDTESTEAPLQSSTEPYEIPTEQGVPDDNEEFYNPSDSSVPEYPVASEFNPDESLTESAKEDKIVSEFETPIDEIQLEPLNDEAEITDSERPIESTQPSSDDESGILYSDASGGGFEFDKEVEEFHGQTQSVNVNEEQGSVVSEEQNPPYSTSEYEIPEDQRSTSSENEFRVSEFEPIEPEPIEHEYVPESVKEVVVISETETPADGIQLEESNDPPEINNSELPLESVQLRSEKELEIGYPDDNDDDSYAPFDKHSAESQGQIQPARSNEYDISVSEEPTPSQYPGNEYEISSEIETPTESEVREGETQAESRNEFQFVSEVETPADGIQLEEFTDQSDASDSELLLERVKGSDEDELPITYPELSSEDFSLDKQGAGFELVSQPERTNKGNDAVVDASREEIYASPPLSNAEDETAADKHFPAHGIPTESENDEERLSVTEFDDVATQTSDELPEAYVENNDQ